ncbi:MAG: putative toxin-antitoxin system toxin component, PIN family [Candidatus Atribacteria bacterium]|nr:putative toxin-antitoxin system toxin component, PIN family [Candidatus Atribacteria bacterium]
MKLRKYEQKFDHIVLDTNVLVAGIINPFGNPAKVLNLVLNGELIINADTRILSEYERVLKSQKFSVTSSMGFSCPEIPALLNMQSRRPKDVTV